MDCGLWTEPYLQSDLSVFSVTILRKKNRKNNGTEQGWGGLGVKYLVQLMVHTKNQRHEGFEPS
jgi:hypothetical protein